MSELFSKPKPLRLSGNLAENYKQFKQSFDFYLTATEKDEKSSEVKLAIYMNCLGEECIPIYNSFTFTDEEDKTKFKDVEKKFSAYCEPRKNITMMRHYFLKRHQKEGETVDQYITDLRLKAKDCEFGHLEESLIRDQIISGIFDEQLQSRLLDKSQQVEDFKLDLCVKMCQSAEFSKIHRTEFRKAAAVDATYQKSRSSINNSSKLASTNNNECPNCGQTHPDDKSKCPAFGKQCHYCKRSNHFIQKCRKREYNRQKVHTVEQEEDVEAFFINSISSTSCSSQGMFLHTSIHDCNVSFKLDTGAQCNTLPYATYKNISSPPPISQVNRKLISYSGHQIPCCGETTLPISHNNHEYQVNFMIVDQYSEPILSLGSCLELGLISALYSITSQDPQIILDQHNDLFSGLGHIGECHITLDPNISPVIHPSRSVPYSQIELVKSELSRMESSGIITPISEPTDWVSSMLIVEKPGKIRLVLDPRDLNKAIKREQFPYPTIEQVSAKIEGATIFSTLDAGQAFYQVSLDEESSKLTTFNTPFGRYRFLRMPFGISCAPEVFQAKMSQMFDDIPGCAVIMDDILIYGKDVNEHNDRLTAVLERAKAMNLTLNREKCKIAQSSVTYIGHVLSSEGLRPDPRKIEAILKMPTPISKQGLRRFLGSVTYLSKFIPNLSTLNAPLRDLLKEDIPWQWDEVHEQCFQRLKTKLTEAPVLRFYDVNLPVTISCDASSEGLGATLWQEEHPIHYASRSLTSAEKSYAQIEKEMLAIEFSATRFHQYIYGKYVTVESDHKPLESLFRKPLATAPLRIQKMMLKLQKYDLNVKYVPGNKLFLADTLSRAFIHDPDPTQEIYEISSIDNLPISQERISEMRQATANDVVLQKLLHTTQVGWPNNRKCCDNDLKQYWNFREEITVDNGIILKGSRIVVPTTLRPKMLEALHESHLGIEKTRRRARDILFWPGMNEHIADVVERCAICQRHAKAQAKEPMICSEVPQSPYEIVGSDIFHILSYDYLLTVDYYSTFVEVNLLQELDSKTTINALKSQFARHGIPKKVRSDNGPQYSSHEFSEFATEYGFKHDTSSPTFAQSNGAAEKAVQTTKNILKKAHEDKRDPYLALLELRNTPIDGVNASPSQLLMSRRTRTRLPINPELLTPEVVKDVPHKLEQRKLTQKRFYDQKAGKDLPVLKPNEMVRYKSGEEWKPAMVVAHDSHPRSYQVRNSLGNTLRRNRKDIRKTKEEFDIPVKTTSNQDIPIPDKLDPNLDSGSTHSMPMAVGPDQTPFSPLPSPPVPDQTPLSPSAQPEATPLRRTRYGRTVVKPLRYQ